MGSRLFHLPIYLHQCQSQWWKLVFPCLWICFGHWVHHCTQYQMWTPMKLLVQASCYHSLVMNCHMMVWISVSSQIYHVTSIVAESWGSSEWVCNPWMNAWVLIRCRLCPQEIAQYIPTPDIYPPVRETSMMQTHQLAGQARARPPSTTSSAQRSIEAFQ